MTIFKSTTAFLCALILGACAVLPYEVEVRKTDGARIRLKPLHGAERLFSGADHNFRQGFVALEDPVRNGTRSERFELRDGDCGGSDCGNPRARAEIEVKQELGKRAIGKDIWYGWSFYNKTVPAFDKANSLRLVFGQWTKGGAGQPIIRFIQLGKGEGNFAGCDPSVCDTQNTKSGDLVVQLKDVATAKGWDKAQNDGYVCRLFNMKDVQGRWVDLTMQTNFSTGDDGYLRIWVDDRLACSYTGPIISTEAANSNRNIKHRHGIYASWTKRWQKTEEGRPQPTLIAYYDEFRSGERKRDVDVKLLRATAPALD